MKIKTFKITKSNMGWIILTILVLVILITYSLGLEEATEEDSPIAVSYTHLRAHET